MVRCVTLILADESDLANRDAPHQPSKMPPKTRQVGTDVHIQHNKRAALDLELDDEWFAERPNVRRDDPAVHIDYAPLAASRGTLNTKCSL
jgi:hypothetical protein